LFDQNINNALHISYANNKKASFVATVYT